MTQTIATFYWTTAATIIGIMVIIVMNIRVATDERRFDKNRVDGTKGKELIRESGFSEEKLMWERERERERVFCPFSTTSVLIAISSNHSVHVASSHGMCSFFSLC